jgi:hypothetical protein
MPRKRSPSDLPRRALSDRQPWAELILRGKKTIEVRSRATNIRGPMYIYAGLTRGADDAKCRATTGCTWEELERGKLIGITNGGGPRRRSKGCGSALASVAIR